jgi:predicted DCC family thiol-disulfide oxidoreductase YuxK
MLSLIPKDKKLILFDGICNLCNTSVQYVIKHDDKDVFFFAPLQSETGKKIINHYNIDTSKIDSILLYSEDNGLAYKSTAALKIASKLGFPLHLLIVFFIVPTFIRNVVYDYIAKNRYKWFGKREECMIPTKKLKEKFLS